MWRDYIGLVPSTAAIVNGSIAVLIAQFFKDQPVARIVLVVSVGILGVAAIAAMFYGRTQVVAARVADEKHRHEVRESIGSYIQRVN